MNRQSGIRIVSFMQTAHNSGILEDILVEVSDILRPKQQSEGTERIIP